MRAKTISGKLQLGMLLAPGLLVFCIFTIYPIVKLFAMSFFEWNLSSMLSQQFIGFTNYRNVFSDKTFWITFVNTLLYTLITVPGQMVLGLFVAYLINKIKRFSVTFRVINYFPVITSWVIASLVFRYCFNTEGLLNYFLTEIMHATESNIRWLDSRSTGLSVVMILGIWKGVGWNMVVFLAALQQVPEDLYEAAEMDGCGAFKKFFSITIPSITPTILFAWIMLTIGGFNVFTSIKLMTGGNPVHQTDTILTWMYFKAFSLGEFGYSAALSFIVALTLGLLAIFQFKAMKNKEKA
jgi:multiple sugar transport system permease protein